MSHATRDPGVEFLGSVPSHWAVQPVVTLARVLTSTVDKKSYEGEQIVELCNYTDVYYNEEITTGQNFMKATATKEQIAKFSVRAGDVPFTKDSETADDIGIPSYVPQDLPGAVYGYHLGIFRPLDKRRGRFLRYLLESDYAKAYFKAKTPGVTRVGLSQATIRYLRAPTPPVEEAVAIADYLDRETAQIDAFIAKNEELITLLTERRTSLARELVTRGSNKGIALKESGVALLGLIPQHWNVVRARYLCTVGTGEGDTIDAVDDGEFPFYVRSDTPQRSDHYGFDTTAVLTSGDGAGVGKVFHLVNGKFAAHQRVYVLHHFHGILPEFFYRFFSAYFGVVALDGSAKSTVDSVRRHMITNMPIAVPPVEEQERIVRTIEERLATIDAASVAARRSIALAKERRAALISAAVTGKIDVRGAT